ncbi:zinc finger protein 311-like [Cyprinodon tularosa]|uniref:zinc finger protein 311-like n=1 Tax=Cyprinodon tularosa TaxID=77115 RepID=UPI0018E2738C|nr:zinc finger protein 311-like [Cyprinodon tularosa]XP_038153190.1 zinc finger protein 311-like [Cyprinodon tularosa]
MSSVQPLREFIRQRLTAAAEEIFSEVEKTIIQYQEEIDRQRGWRPRTEQNQAEPSQDHDRIVKKVRFDQKLCNQDASIGPNQTIQSAGPARVKEEPKEPEPLTVQEEKLCVSEAEEQRVFKNEVDFFLVTAPDEEPEPNRYRLASLGPEAENQNQAGTSDASAQTAEKSVSCDLCGKAFKHSYKMKIHRRTHTGERPFSCKNCGKRFMRSSGLSVHMRIHTGQKPYSCKTCGKRFTQLSSLNYHMKTHTDVLQQENHQTEEALCIQDRSSSLDKAEPKTQQAGNQETKLFMLEPDQLHYQKSAKVEDLDQNSLVDNGCPLEGQSKNCPTDGDVERGLSGQGPIGAPMAKRSVRCDVCGKAYKHNYEMQAHRRTHTGERPFSCKICGKGFMRSSGLAVHTRIHTGQRPYTCGICGKSFTQLNSLNYHRGTHLDCLQQEDQKAGEVLQEKSSNLNQEEPEPPQIKEEQEEICTGQVEDQPVLKKETETFMVTPAEGEKIGPGSNMG